MDECSQESGIYKGKHSEHRLLGRQSTEPGSQEEVTGQESESHGTKIKGKFSHTPTE